MGSSLQFLRLSPNNDIFQVSDGIRHGVVEIDENGPLPFNRLASLMRPQVQAVVHHWLSERGCLIGSQHPPRLSWIDIQARLAAHPEETAEPKHPVNGSRPFQETTPHSRRRRLTSGGSAS